MKKKLFITGSIKSINPKVVLGLALAIASCQKKDVIPQQLKNFRQVNLVANKIQYNPKTIDPTLINGFGMAWSPSGIAWVNSVGGHVSELYNAEGSIVSSAVKIPSPTDTINGLPTGIVFGGLKGFQIPNGSAAFLFSGFDGVISGWNSAAGSTAKRLKTPPNASYTGLTIASDGKDNFLYAANFGASKIDVWDTAFTRVSGSFADPSLPAGFSPYNIQAVGNLLFVLYSEIGNNGLPVAGKGKGFVNIFSADGNFIQRFASEGALNVPWGITEAQRDFLQPDDLVNESNSDIAKSNPGTDLGEAVILIGNFGDGRINVFTVHGRYLGQLKSKDKPLEIDGLWALTFPPSTAAVDPRRLYFTAGPNHESDGVFGYIIKD